MTIGLALILVGGFMPWLRSGRAWRNSYEVVRTADRLGLVGSGYQSAFAACWYLVPLLCGLTLTSIVYERSAPIYLGTTVVSGFVIVMAVVAWRAPLRLGRGPVVAAFGALLAIAGLVMAAADHHVRRTDAQHAGRDAGREAGRENVRAVTRAPVRWRRSAR